MYVRMCLSMYLYVYLFIFRIVNAYSCCGETLLPFGTGLREDLCSEGGQ